MKYDVVRLEELQDGDFAIFFDKEIKKNHVVKDEKKVYKEDEKQ